MTQVGELRPFLTNANYILLDKKYLSVLKGLSGQVDFENSEISDPNSNLTNGNYVELNIKNKIDPRSIQSLNSAGQKIWRHKEYIFVSGDLKNELTKRWPDDFIFSSGFSLFG